MAGAAGMGVVWARHNAGNSTNQAMGNAIVLFMGGFSSFNDRP